MVVVQRNKNVDGHSAKLYSVSCDFVRIRQGEQSARMPVEPLRSAMSSGQVGDTSLAVPSDTNMRSAHQRVMEQVHTIARTKSKLSSKGGSGLPSPLSSHSDSVFYDVPSFKASTNTMKGSTCSNGFVNGHLTLGHTNGHTKTDSAFSHKTLNTTRSFSRRSTSAQRNSSSSGSMSGPRVAPLSPRSAQRARIQVEGLSRTSRTSRTSSRSVPDLNTRLVGEQRNGDSLHHQSQHRTLLRTNHHTQQHSQGGQWKGLSSASSPHMVLDGPGGPFVQIGASSQPNMTTHTFIKQPLTASFTNTSKAKTSSSEDEGESHGGEISLLQAIHFLGSQEEALQLCGASYIQHTTYTEDTAKQQVFEMKGIPPLLALLQSPNPQIQETASAALRNLVYKNHGNKEEVSRCGGVAKVLQLLKDNQSVETQRHLTGLLWNLSSADSLKSQLVRNCVPVLTEQVLVPSTGPNDLEYIFDPEIFYNTTSCLRNLSSAKAGNRQAMRKTTGLVDALAAHVHTCVADDKPDDKSVENCVCILHNLTYQLEAEFPQLFSRVTALGHTSTRNSSSPGPISCFSTQSTKISQDACFDYPVIEDSRPQGCAWLFHSKTLQSYLSLLGTSQNHNTLEACCGTLQNLTANNGVVSLVLSQCIVGKLNGMRVIGPLLKRDESDLKSSSIHLIGNLARNPRTHTSMARQTLPSLTDFISAGVAPVTQDKTEADKTMATAILTTHTLLRAEPDMGKGLLSNSLINSLNNMTYDTTLPMSSKAAAFLLYNLWAEKDFQSSLKKQGLPKKAFVNDITTAALRSVLVID